jgi:FkbM family methyltransferase
MPLSLSSETRLGRFVRFPLRLVPPGTVVPILKGKLRGKRWVVGSAIHRCWLGFFESDKQDQICREIRPNTVFYDIGANVGFYSLLASMLVGQGRVFAFEPLPVNIRFLKTHLALNQIQNVEVLELAVCDHVGESSFLQEETRSMGHLQGEGGLRVRTTTLDSLVQANKIDPPQCIKMDIEGTELLALRGASQTFQRYHPLLFLATHGREVHEACCQLLESWGYRLQLLSGSSLEDRAEVVATYRS